MWPHAFGGVGSTKQSKISNPDRKTMPWFTKMVSQVSKARGFNTRACSSAKLFIMVLLLSKQNSSQSVSFLYCWNDVDFVWWCAQICFIVSLHEIQHKQSPTHLLHTTRFLFPLVMGLQVRLFFIMQYFCLYSIYLAFSCLFLYFISHNESRQFPTSDL